MYCKNHQHFATFIFLWNMWDTDSTVLMPWTWGLLMILSMGLKKKYEPRFWGIELVGGWGGSDQRDVAVYKYTNSLLFVDVVVFVDDEWCCCWWCWWWWWWWWWWWCCCCCCGCCGWWMMIMMMMMMLLMMFLVMSMLLLLVLACCAMNCPSYGWPSNLNINSDHQEVLFFVRDSYKGTGKGNILRYTPQRSPFPFPLQNGWARALYKPNILLILGSEKWGWPVPFCRACRFLRCSFAPKPFCRENSW